MAHFTGCKVCAVENAAIHNDAAADARAERDGNKILYAGARSGLRLAKGRTVGVVFQINGLADPFTQHLLRRNVLKIQIVGEFDNACRLIDRARRADADGGDILHGEPGCFYRHMYRFRNIVKDLLRRAGRIRLQLPYADDSIIVIHHARTNVGAP